MSIFSILWSHILTQIDFSGKITILSYKTIFGPTYSVISGILVEQFFRKFQKLVILGQNGHFLARLAKIGQNEEFYQKSGRAIFLPLLSPNFMPSFRKIVGAVSEINSLRTDGRTDTRTYGRTKVISQNRSLSLVQYARYNHQNQ